MSSDSWALKELADHLIKSSEETAQLQVQEPPLEGYRAFLAESLEEALEMVGRSGREVLFGILEKRYDLRRKDIVDKTGLYLSALRDLLGSSSTVVERQMLSSIRDRMGIDAHTLEEAVFKLRKRYGEQ